MVMKRVSGIFTGGKSQFMVDGSGFNEIEKPSLEKDDPAL